MLDFFPLGRRIIDMVAKATQGIRRDVGALDGVR